VLACFALAPLAEAAPGEDRGNGNSAAEHVDALNLSTTGVQNTAHGWSSLFSNTSGNDNTANGYQALLNNTTGLDNTANGSEALFSNTAGNFNTANGVGALHENTTGNRNTANGFFALYGNTTGHENTATGFQALNSNTTGEFNSANGWNALQHNITGVQNTASGFNALLSNQSGSFNTAVGGASLLNANGSGNTALGYLAGNAIALGNDNIDIGNTGVASDSATIRIGSGQTATFIVGIRGVTTGNADAVPVLIDSAGQLGTMSSSRRFKKEIKPMDKASDAILALKPVTFHYKSDNTDTPQFGLIAEEVAQVNPALVVHDEKGEIYTVRYEAINAMLLNEFLNEHRKNEEQEATITLLQTTDAKQEAIIAKQQKQIEALTEGLQKVNTQLEASKPAPQVVNNP
jgi:uncharacterized coiled-coil protein SlyX